VVWSIHRTRTNYDTFDSLHQERERESVCDGWVLVEHKRKLLPWAVSITVRAAQVLVPKTLEQQLMLVLSLTIAG
jgi:hypothetical protein